MDFRERLQKATERGQQIREAKRREQTAAAISEEECRQSILGIERGGLGSAAGYVQVELFSLMVPLLLIGYMIAGGSAATAGEQEAGTLEFLLSQPVSRRRVLLEKYLGLGTALAVISIAFVAVLIISTCLFALDIGIPNLLAATASAYMLGLLFGAVTLLAGCITGHRALAAGIASAAAVSAYLLSTLATLVVGLKRFRPLSPFWWYSGHDPLRAGLEPLHVGLLLVRDRRVHHGHGRRLRPPRSRVVWWCRSPSTTCRSTAEAHASSFHCETRADPGLRSARCRSRLPTRPLVLLDVSTVNAAEGFTPATVSAITRPWEELAGLMHERMRFAIVAGTLWDQASQFADDLDTSRIRVIPFTGVHTAATWLGLPNTAAQQIRTELRTRLRTPHSRQPQDPEPPNTHH